MNDKTEREAFEKWLEGRDLRETCRKLKLATDFMYESIGRDFGSMEPLDAAKAWQDAVLYDKQNPLIEAVRKVPSVDELAVFKRNGEIA